MTNEERQTVIDAQREAFEAAMGAAGYACNPPIYRDGTYRFPHYAADWEMWQAATLAERERCADICDQHATCEGIAQRCAALIRKG